MNEALDRCGFPLCRGQVMASNPQWCLSLSEWRRRFALWIDEPDPQALLNASIFFDFRPIHGNHAVVAELRAWLAHYAADRGRFLLPDGAERADRASRRSASCAISRWPAAESTRDTLDLKVNGVQLFVESARIFALAAGVTATNTLERFAGVAKARNLSPVDVDAWVRGVSLHPAPAPALNAAQQARGLPLHNHLDPATLNDLDRRILKEALRQARKLQSRLTRDFSVTNASFGA